MKKQILHISIHQTSKVFAIIYFVFAAIICVPLGFFTLFYGEITAALVMFFLPFFYLLLGYIAIAVVSWFYNLVAKSFGGVEFTLANVEDKPE
ncbi:MAG: hypothetical protein ACE5GN_02520 [Waddliaceae bacterium]